MLRRMFAAALLFVTLASAAPQTTTPAGFDEMVREIQQTKLDDFDQLRGREWTLRTSSLPEQTTLSVEPQAAFTTRASPSGGGFIVTLTDPAALLSDDPLAGFRIRWSIVSTASGTGEISAAIEGDARCNYRVEFRQVGYQHLDLSRLSATYDQEWALSRENAVQEVRRSGTGLDVVRTPGSRDPVNLTLTLKHKTNGTRLTARPVAIPACVTGDAPRVVQTVDPEPSSCLVTEVETTNTCDQCGPLTVDFRIKVRNVCRRQVRCGYSNKIYYDDRLVASSPSDYQVYIAGGGEWAFTNSLSVTPYRTPFRTTSPGLHSCRYDN